MRVVFHRDARAETKAGKYWFVERDPASPMLFQRSLDAAVETLGTFPESGQSYLHGTRRMPLQSVPYSLIYRIETNRVFIIAVAHAKQRPGYWRGR